MRHRTSKRATEVTQIGYGHVSKLQLLYSFLKWKVLAKRQSSRKAVRDSHPKKGTTGNQVFMFLGAWNCSPKTSVNISFAYFWSCLQCSLVFHPQANVWSLDIFLRYTCGGADKVPDELKIFPYLQEQKVMIELPHIPVFMGQSLYRATWACCPSSTWCSGNARWVNARRQPSSLIVPAWCYCTAA